MSEQSIYEVQKLEESSWVIKDYGNGALQPAYQYLFVGKEKALLVDTSFGTGNLKEVVGSLTNLPLMVVNTHADRDHIGCNHLFEQEQIFMHPAEFDRYNTSPGGEGLTACALWEGDVIDLGGRKFEVVLIPGHTPGSIALIDDQNRIALTGDSVQTGHIFMFQPGRNIHAYIHSLEKLSKMTSRFDLMYPGHGEIAIKPTHVDELLTCVKALLKGKYEGVKAPKDFPTKLYDLGIAKFLYGEE